MDIKEQSDEYLISEYRNGNQQAFNVLYERYTSLVKFKCRKLYLLGGEIEDLYQEGYRGLLNAVNSYVIDNGSCSFKTYASRCIENSIFTALRRYVKFSGDKSFDSSNEGTGYDIEDKIIEKYETNLLNKERRNFLSRQENEVLDLFIEGLRYSEIAEKIGKSVKAVDRTLGRAREKIDKYIKNRS